MTHEEQINFMADRIAHLEKCQESAMGMVATLMGKLQPPRSWVGLTVKEIEEIAERCLDIDRRMTVWGLFAQQLEEKIQEKNNA